MSSNDEWKEAEVTDFDEDAAELLCSIDGQEVRCGPAHVRFKEGALVTVHGIQAKKELNEQNGKAFRSISKHFLSICRRRFSTSMSPSRGRRKDRRWQALRYTVQISAEKRFEPGAGKKKPLRLRIKPENLRLCPLA